MEPVEIHEAGLVLRPWRPEDADAVYRACQDAEIQRWTTVPRPYLREHAEGFTSRPWPEDGSAPLGVFDGANGELLGASGLVELDRAGGTGEVGYWTAPWARGRGVATNAARATARWALHHLGLKRLVWQAEVGNHASRLVALRVGVQLEGLLRQALRRADGGRVDGWIGSLLPGEIREASTPLPTYVELRARTFAAPRPTLDAITQSGERVTLRALAERDIDPVTETCRDPEAVRWTTVPHPYSRAHGEHFVRRHGPARWAEGAGLTCAIAGPDDSYAGSIELTLRDDPSFSREAEVGFLVSPWARGKGYASGALAALCEWGFEALAVERINWRAYVGNEASRRTALRAGFVEEGVARAGCVQRGEPRDAWVATKLATDR